MAPKTHPPKKGKTPTALKPKPAKITKSRTKPDVVTHKSKYSERLEKWAAQVSKTKALILGTSTTAKRIVRTTFANTDRERKSVKRSSEREVLETRPVAKMAKSKKDSPRNIGSSSNAITATLGIKVFQKAVANLSLKNKLSGRLNEQAPRKIRKLKKVTAALSTQRATACLSSIASELEELESGQKRMLETPKHLVKM
jgi:hypothetical protein